MTSFFKKLNTLVQSQINDVIRPLSSDESDSDTPRKRTARQEVSKGLSRDVQMLRKRIEDALDYERTLQTRVDKLYADITRWDDYVDKAVAQGREGDAKMGLGQLQQAQRNLAQAEESLREHQEVTQDLINRVNYMEYVVNQASEEATSATSGDNASRSKIPVEVDNDEDEAVAESQEPSQTVHVIGQAPDTSRLAKPSEPSPQPPKATATSQPSESKPNAQKPSASSTPKQVQTPSVAPTPKTTPASPEAHGDQPKKRKDRYAEKGDQEYAEGVELAKQINEKLDTTREKLAELVAQSTPLEPQRDVIEEVKREIDQQAVDADLAKRLARLSKPDEKS
jgi:phage shock protein A